MSETNSPPTIDHVLNNISADRFLVGNLDTISNADRSVILACLNLAYEILKNPGGTWEHKNLYDVLAILWSKR